MEKNRYYVSIADVSIGIKTDFDVLIGQEGEQFFCRESIPTNIKNDISFNIQKTNNPLTMGKKIFDEDEFFIYETEFGFTRQFTSIISKKPYAWLTPYNEYNYNLSYLSGREEDFKYSKNILEGINIESILNKFNGFILHSSFINWQNNGILFSAPSGTGKSTQADLWNKHENAEIINGDRAGVRNVDGVWSAYGLPVGGSSGIYKNKKAQISHIIVLRQGTENKLTRLSPRDAFIKIYSETTVHTWDDEFQNNILNMISDLVQNVPVYLYECLPDESAVEFLKEQIMKDNKL